MQNQSFPCVELLSTLFHNFANKTTMNHFRLEKDQHKLIVLMPKPFQMILFTELFALEADETLFNRVDMKHPLHVERLPHGLKVNGIKVVPHYKMELVLYHDESILHSNGELCSVIEMIPGVHSKNENPKHEVSFKVIFEIGKRFPSLGL